MPEGRHGPRVPDRWSPAVDAARADLARRLAIPLGAVAAARAADGTELAQAAPDSALAVWLVAGGETFRYVVDLAASPPATGLVGAPSWLRLTE